jgi:limonene 1,2-monooxygenase
MGNGLLAAYRESRRHVVEHRDAFQRANQAVLSKINENERAAAALALTRNGRFAMPAHQAPDMEKLGQERS